MALSTGCYLLAVIGEPASEDHKQFILQRLNKGLLSWDVNATGCDLKGLENVCATVKEDKTALDNDLLIQYSTESLGVEVLVNPPVSTLKQCVKNLLTSTIGHKHIIHAGYTFTGSGSWMLQNGTYSFEDFLSAFRDAQVQSQKDCTIHIHCAEEGDWNSSNFEKEVFAKVATISLNPPDKLDQLPGAKHLVDCLQSVLNTQSLTEIMEASPLVGNIRFNRPTLYLFPAGQGDCALFGINGFNMLVDGGFNRKPCSWEFIRHLDRLDAVLVTRLSESNLCSMSTLMKRKTLNNTYPQIGYVFCNIADGKVVSPAEELQKDKNELLVSVVGEGHEFIHTLNDLKLVPHQCWCDSSTTEPFVLYHKVGHGTLEMHVLSPPKDSKEMKDFLSEWSSYKEKFSCVKNGLKNKSQGSSIPLTHATSICAILVWRPNDPKDTITRIMFPGSAPQNKIFEGLEKLKNLDILRHPTVTKASLSTILVSKTKKVNGVISRPAIPNRKSTASPALSVSSMASRNGDIGGLKKEIKEQKQDNKIIKEIKRVSKEVKKDTKAKDVKKDKDAKELKKDVVKKEPKIPSEKKIAPKPAVKKTEPTSKSTVDVKKTTVVKKTVKKETTAKPLMSTKPEIKAKSPPTKTSDTKNAKEVINKKAAETKTAAKPKAKSATSKAPPKSKPTPVPKSPSKLTRAIAASAAVVATAAVTLGVAEHFESKKEEAEEEEILKVEIKEDAVNNVEIGDLPNGEIPNGDQLAVEQNELLNSPLRQDALSPALSEPVSLTASDTLSSAPIENVSPIPPPLDAVSPVEEKDVNETKDVDLGTPIVEGKLLEQDIDEIVSTPVHDEHHDLSVDEGIAETDVGDDNEMEIEICKDISESNTPGLQEEEKEITVDETNKNLMATSLIGESLEMAEEELITKKSAIDVEAEKHFIENASTVVDTKSNEFQDMADIDAQLASATMEGSFCVGMESAQDEICKYAQVATEEKNEEPHFSEETMKNQMETSVVFTETQDELEIQEMEQKEGKPLSDNSGLEYLGVQDYHQELNPSLEVNIHDSHSEISTQDSDIRSEEIQQLSNMEDNRSHTDVKMEEELYDRELPTNVSEADIHMEDIPSGIEIHPVQNPSDFHLEDKESDMGIHMDDNLSDTEVVKEDNQNDIGLHMENSHTDFNIPTEDCRPAAETNENFYDQPEANDYDNLEANDYDNLEANNYDNLEANDYDNLKPNNYENLESEIVHEDNVGKEAASDASILEKDLDESGTTIDQSRESMEFVQSTTEEKVPLGSSHAEYDSGNELLENDQFKQNPPLCDAILSAELENPSNFDNITENMMRSQEFQTKTEEFEKESDEKESTSMIHHEELDDSRRESITESEDDVDLQHYMSKSAADAAGHDKFSNMACRESDSGDDDLKSPSPHVVVGYNNEPTTIIDEISENPKAVIENDTDDHIEVYPSEEKQMFDEKDHDSAEEEEEMIRHPTPPGSREFYEQVGPSGNVDEMKDHIPQHYISAPTIIGKNQEEPLYEESEDSGSERSQSPIEEQPIFSNIEKVDYPELVTVSGGTTPSEPQSPKSPLDSKKGNLGTLDLEVMEALSEHDCSESSSQSPLVRDESNTFESLEKDAKMPESQELSSENNIEHKYHSEQQHQAEQLAESLESEFDKEHDQLPKDVSTKLLDDQDEVELQLHMTSESDEHYDLGYNARDISESDLANQPESDFHYGETSELVCKPESEQHVKLSSEIQPEENSAESESVDMHKDSTRVVQAECSEMDYKCKDAPSFHHTMEESYEKEEDFYDQHGFLPPSDFASGGSLINSDSLKDVESMSVPTEFLNEQDEMTLVQEADLRNKEYSPHNLEQDLGNGVEESYQEQETLSRTDGFSTFNEMESKISHKTYSENNEVENSYIESVESHQNTEHCMEQKQFESENMNYEEPITSISKHNEIYDDSTKEIPESERHYRNGFSASNTDPEDGGYSTYNSDQQIPAHGINGQNPNSWDSYSNELSGVEPSCNTNYNSTYSGMNTAKIISGEQQMNYVMDSHYQSDSPEDNSMKNSSTPDVPSPIDPEIADDPHNPLSVGPPVGYDGINNKFMLPEDEYPPENINYVSAIPPPLKTKNGRSADSPYGESSEDDEEEDSSSLPGNVSPYAYTNKAYNQEEEEDADGNHIIKQPLRIDQTKEDGNQISNDSNNPHTFPENISFESHHQRVNSGVMYSPGFNQEINSTDPAAYDFRLEEWGKPMGLPTPPETVTKATKKPVKAKSTVKTADKRSSLENGKSATPTSKLMSSPLKKVKEASSDTSSPVYVDLAYVPHHGDPHYSDVEFFKRIRARYYVFSGINPSKEVLNALLEAKKAWNEDLETTIIPTYETDTLGYWMVQNQEALTEYSIDVAPSASRCTVNLQDHETSCAAYRLEF